MKRSVCIPIKILCSKEYDDIDDDDLGMYPFCKQCCMHSKQCSLLSEESRLGRNTIQSSAKIYYMGVVSLDDKDENERLRGITMMLFDNNNDEKK